VRNEEHESSRGDDCGTTEGVTRAELPQRTGTRFVHGLVDPKREVGVHLWGMDEIQASRGAPRNTFPRRSITRNEAAGNKVV